MNDFKRGLKIGVWDIETSGLEAYFDRLICACIIEPDKTLKTFRIDQTKNWKESDKDLTKVLIEELNKYDLLVGWYTSGFDFRFINTRALIHNLKPPIKNYRRDLCFVSRGNLQLRNNKLATVNLSLFGNSSKTYLKPNIRWAAMTGKKWAIDFYVNHCRKDVLDTLRTYKRMLPLLSAKLRRGG